MKVILIKHYKGTCIKKTLIIANIYEEKKNCGQVIGFTLNLKEMLEPFIIAAYTNINCSLSLREASVTADLESEDSC